MSAQGKVVLDSGAQKFDTGTHLAEATCPHVFRGACGGCYARVLLTLILIDKEPEHARSYVSRLWNEMEGDRQS